MSMDQVYPIRVLTLVLVLCSGSVPGVSADPLERGLSPSELLDKAFHSLYGCNLRMTVSLTVRNRLGEESSRHIEVARKWIDGRLNSVGHFVEPDWMRGTRILVIENDDRSDDQFLYMPDMRKIRRVSAAQQTDFFVGTDLWYEDLGKRRVADYEIRPSKSTPEGAEHVTIRALPRRSTGYDRVEFVVSQRDFFLAAMRFYRNGESDPFKVIEATRDTAILEDGYQIPTRLRVENRRRGTTTEARFQQVAINPPLDDALFTARALQGAARIPGLKR